MSDFLADTPDLARRICPACEPDLDPIAEITETRWCGQHKPTDAGDMDDRVVAVTYLVGTAEAEGETCRAWAAWIAGRS